MQPTHSTPSFSPSLQRDFVQSLIDFGEQNEGHLPVWNMFASETDMMIGYHSVPVIVEAVLRGIYVPKDKAKLLHLLRTTAERKGYRGLDDYRKKGYVASDREDESVSKTLEYAYDDDAIARYAAWMGDREGGEDLPRARPLLPPPLGREDRLLPPPQEQWRAG